MRSMRRFDLSGLYLVGFVSPTDVPWLIAFSSVPPYSVVDSCCQPPPTPSKLPDPLLLIFLIIQVQVQVLVFLDVVALTAASDPFSCSLPLPGSLPSVVLTTEGV